MKFIVLIDIKFIVFYERNNLLSMSFISTFSIRDHMVALVKCCACTLLKAEFLTAYEHLLL